MGRLVGEPLQRGDFLGQVRATIEGGRFREVLVDATVDYLSSWPLSWSGWTRQIAPKAKFGQKMAAK